MIGLTTFWQWRRWLFFPPKGLLLPVGSSVGNEFVLLLFYCGDMEFVCSGNMLRTISFIFCSTGKNNLGNSRRVILKRFILSSVKLSSIVLCRYRILTYIYIVIVHRTLFSLSAASSFFILALEASRPQIINYHFASPSSFVALQLSKETINYSNAEVIQYWIEDLVLWVAKKVTVNKEIWSCPLFT